MLKPVPPMSSSFFLFFFIDLSFGAECRNKMSWVSVQQDPRHELDAEWMYLWADFWDGLYVEDVIYGPCVEAKQVRITQIDIGYD